MTPFQEQMAALRRRFLARAEGERDRLIDAIGRGDAAEIGAISHRLAGIAGIFGFAALGDAARQLEEALESQAAAAEIDRSCRHLLDQLEAALQAASGR